MKAFRQCSRTGCQKVAVATLTYQYEESTVVLGPLSTSAEPNTYDLCADHADSLTAPKGWQIVRLQDKFEPAPPSEDDLLALADAVREASRQQGPKADPTPPPPPRPQIARGSQHGHLRVISDSESSSHE